MNQALKTTEALEIPTQEYFDAALLRCCGIHQIRSQKLAVVARGEDFYYQIYDRGRHIGQVGFSEGPQIFSGCDRVKVGNTIPDIDPDTLDAIIAGRQTFNDSSMDQVARKCLTLDQIVNNRLFVFVTNDPQAGYKRLYCFRKGFLVFDGGDFAKVKNADIEASLWVFAFTQVGTPNYTLFDLTKKLD